MNHAPRITPSPEFFAEVAIDFATRRNREELFASIARFAALLAPGCAAAISLVDGRSFVDGRGHVLPTSAIESETAAEPRNGPRESTPLEWNGRTLGAIELSAGPDDALPPRVRDTLRVLAAHASVAIMALRNTEDLTVAVESRTIIGQAQGILMERYSIDSERAFLILQRYSHDNNVKLIEIARSIVATRSLPGF